MLKISLQVFRNHVNSNNYVPVGWYKQNLRQVGLKILLQVHLQ